MPDLLSLCDDLDAESRVVDALVADLDEAGWATPTPAEGWDVRTQIGHLYFADARSVLAATDRPTFEKLRDFELADERSNLNIAMLGRDAGSTGAETLATWRDGRARFQQVFRALDPGVRVPWYGPDMSPLSMVTARIMETWAHGQDVADALGAVTEPTDRLRHVAHIGVGARRWSYTTNRREMPDAAVFVELHAPSGDVWRWGDPSAAERVVGDALDFCRVVTQRRHVDDTALVVTGDAAREWMLLAQAYAGPPGRGRPRLGGA